MADARARAEPTPDALRHRTDTAARRKTQTPAVEAVVATPAVVLPEPTASPVEVWEPPALPLAVEETPEESPSEEEVDGTQEF